MSALRSQPLQPLNSGQLNARANNITPVKSIRRPRKMFNQQTKTKEKEGKVIGIVQDTPSIVRTRNGRDYRRGNFWVKEGLLVVFK